MRSQVNFLCLTILTFIKESLSVPSVRVVPRWQTRFGTPTKYMEIGDLGRCEECLVDVLRIRDDPWWCNHEVNACCYSFFGENLDALQYSAPKQPEYNFFRKTNWCCEHCISGVGQHEQGIENPWDCNFECGRCCFSWYGQSRVYAPRIEETKEKFPSDKFVVTPEFRS